MEKATHTLRVWAAEYGAAVLAVEQRFTQSSYPIVDMTNSEMVRRYSTIEQNLADISYLVRNLSTIFTENAKWVWFGTAFDGNFVAWHRATSNSPASLMSVSIAAPIKAVLGYSLYDQLLADKFDVVMDGCANWMHSAIDYMTHTTQNATELAQSIGCSTPGGMTGVADVMYVVSRAVETFVQPGGNGLLVCQQLQRAIADSDRAQIVASHLFNATGLCDAYNVFANRRVITPPATTFLTVYALKCDHLAQFQTSADTNRSAYSSLLNEIWYLDACHRVLGYGQVPDVDRFNGKFNSGPDGGPAGTNMVFVGAQASLTQGLEIRQPLSDTQDCYLVSDKAVSIYTDILADDNAAAEAKSADVREAHRIILARLQASLQALHHGPGSNNGDGSNNDALSPGLVVLIVVLCLCSVGVGLVIGRCLWSRRKEYIARRGSLSNRYETLSTTNASSNL